METLSLIKKTKEVLGDLINETNDIWLVRGKLRSHLLNCTQEFDDFDLVVSDSSTRILEILKKYNFTYTLNFYGNPKIKFENGTIVDIWSLESQKVSNIQDALNQFAFSVDSLALNLKSGELIGSPECFDHIKNKVIEFQQIFTDTANQSSICYHLFKAAYLITRHNMTMGPQISKYLEYNFILDHSKNKAITNLTKELELLNVNSRIISNLDTFASESINKNKMINLQMLLKPVKFNYN